MKKYYNPELPMVDQLNCPERRASREQWANLIRIWNTDAKRKARAINKANRAQKRVGHATGMKSFARVRAEEEKKGDLVNRAEFFKKTHLRKDGTPVDDASKEMMEKLEQIFSQTTREGSQSTQMDKHDSFSQPAGGERPGRVRLTRLGIPPSKVFSRSARESTAIEEVRAQNNSLKEEVIDLKRAVACMEDRYQSMEAKLEMLMTRQVH